VALDRLLEEFNINRNAWLAVNLFGVATRTGLLSYLSMINPIN
jgi:hypothetical protein